MQADPKLAGRGASFRAARGARGGVVSRWFCGRSSPGPLDCPETGRPADLRRVVARSLTLAVLSSCWLQTSGLRAAFEADDVGWEGGSSLVSLARAELGSERVRVIRAVDYSVLQPGDALVFLHPLQDIHFRALAAFLRQGGRAAVIDDHGRGDRLLQRFQVHRVSAPADPLHQLQENPELAIAVPAPSDPSGAGAEHPTVLGVDQVVTNHPTALRLEPGVELTALLTIPARSGEDALLAITGVIGDSVACGLEGAPRGGRCGRLVAMGDPSAFINLMLRFPGNQRFARGLVRYLVEDDAWGRREGNLYLLSERFRQIGAPDASDLADWLDEGTTTMAGWLTTFRAGGLPEPVSIGLAAMLALLVVGWAGLAGGRRMARVLPAYARPTPLTAQGGYAGRFAVLALPSTDRGLLLLELKRSLEETLVQRLALPSDGLGVNLVETVRARRLLSGASLRALERLFERLRAGEVAVMSARRLSMSDRALDELRRSVEDISGELWKSEGRRGDGRPEQRGDPGGS